MKLNARIHAAVTICILCMLTLMPANKTNAYSCVEQPDPLEAIQKYDTVFTGKVVGMRQEKVRLPKAVLYKTYVTFEVNQTWQGTQQGKIIVVGEPGLLEFEEGKEYLVYANTVMKDHQVFRQGEIRTSVCSRTVEVSEAGYDLQQLGNGQVPLPVEQMKEKGNGLSLIIIWVVLLILGVTFAVLYYRRSCLKQR